MKFVGIDSMRRVHTPLLCSEKKGMYPDANTLPKQPYLVRSAAGLVDLHTNRFTCCYRDETSTTRETRTFELDEGGLAAFFGMTETDT
jgi:hypothetical protein